jgi:hypothetical protein
MGEQLNEGTARVENPSQSLPGAHPMQLMGKGTNEIVEGIRKDTGSYKLHEMHIDGLKENYAVEQGKPIEAGAAAGRAVGTAEEAGRAAGTAAGQTGKLEENKAYKSPGGCPGINDADGEVLTKKGLRSSDGVEKGKPLQEDQGEMKQDGESVLKHLPKFQNDRVKEAPEQQFLHEKNNYVPDENVPEQKR